MARRRTDAPDANIASSYRAQLAETKRAALKALEHYGKPQMSREELRAALSAALPNTSLSDVILAERAAGS